MDIYTQMSKDLIRKIKKDLDELEKNLNDKRNIAGQEKVCEHPNKEKIKTSDGGWYIYCPDCSESLLPTFRA